MTTATPAGPAARTFHHPGIFDCHSESHGHGRAHVQAPPPHSRRSGGGDASAARARCAGRQRFRRRDPIKNDLDRALVRTFTHYQDNLRWQQENIAVRTIGPGQAEPALVGQQGVFAKHDIPAGTPIGLFGGQYLGNPGDVRLDERVRQMAGIPPRKYWDTKVSDSGGVVQAMCPMMKCNSAGKAANISSSAQVSTIGPAGENIRLTALFTTRAIRAGEELRMDYRLGL